MQAKAWRVAAVVAAGVLVVSGCTSSVSADKAGSETRVLKIAVFDRLQPTPQYAGNQAFVDALPEVSDGRLQVEVVEAFGWGEENGEARLVSAIASGEVDGGLPSVRAFPAAGIVTLAPIEAPLTITSYAAQKALVSGAVAEHALASLKGTGIVGLGLSVGPLRRPFAQTALVDPAAWKGVPFTLLSDSVQAATVTALGGTPRLGYHTAGAQATEIDVTQYLSNGYNVSMPNAVGNIVLWPKVVVFALSQKTWDTLTEQQREWVTEAAEAGTAASTDATYDDSDVAVRLCAEGARFPEATDAQVSALRAAVEPVVADLAAGPAASLLTEVQAIAAQYPEVEALNVPVGCREPAVPLDVPAVISEPSDLPAGTYRATVTLADVTAAGLTNNNGWTGTWTRTVLDDETYTVTCRPVDEPGTDCGGIAYDATVGFDFVLEAGHVYGGDGVAIFSYDGDLHDAISGCATRCTAVQPYGGAWRLDGDELTFTQVDGVEADPTLTMVTWVKVS